MTGGYQLINEPGFISLIIDSVESADGTPHFYEPPKYSDLPAQLSGDKPVVVKAEYGANQYMVLTFDHFGAGWFCYYVDAFSGDGIIIYIAYDSGKVGVVVRLME